MVVHAAPVTPLTVVVAVDVGKTEFAFSVTDCGRSLLLKPRTGCAMTGPSLAQVVAPQTLGSDAHPPLDPAPGRYVRDQAPD